MSIKADKKYTGTIVSGSKLIETQTGSLGYQVMLECEDGQTSFTIWLTPKAIEKAKKTFANVLGINENDLKSQTYLDFQLAQDITGKEVSFGTKEEEYNGKKSIKVAWIGKKSDPNLARGAASLFGGNQPMLKEQRPLVEEQRPIDDNDIPF